MKKENKNKGKKREKNSSFVGLMNLVISSGVMQLWPLDVFVGSRLADWCNVIFTHTIYIYNIHTHFLICDLLMNMFPQISKTAAMRS